MASRNWAREISSSSGDKVQEHPRKGITRKGGNTYLASYYHHGFEKLLEKFEEDVENGTDIDQVSGDYYGTGDQGGTAPSKE